MSERRRARRRRDEYSGPGEQRVEQPSKIEYTVAKWLKKNVKTKKTKFLSHNVEYFTSSKAIDALMRSKFAQGDQALFNTREQIIDLLDVMLEHKFFHRAKKVPISLDELRGKNADKADKSEKVTATATTTAATTSTSAATTNAKKDAASADRKSAAAVGGGSGKSKDGHGRKDTDNEKKDTEAEAEAAGIEADSGAGSAAGGGAAGGSGDKKEKRKRKIRLDMHPEQIFVDGSEAYVWIYDPIPLHYWIFGFILLLGAVGICLFPLWPPMLRQGVYYLSVLAAGFLVFILALTVLRLIIFTIVWALTGGKLHFWIFPNLTEDVGFFASFWPLYESKYVNDDNDKTKSDKKSKSKSKKKDKDSDAEDEVAVPDLDIDDAEADNDVDVDGDADADMDNDADGDGDGDGDADADLDTTPLEPEKIEEVKEHDADMEMRRRHIDCADQHISTATQQSGGDEAAKHGTSSRLSDSDSDGASKEFEIINSSDVQNVT